MSTRKPQAKIQDYGIVGDCRSAALISRYGSLDWLCWPRFDSPCIFGALLDPNHGGFWNVAPTGRFDTERSYIENTNVLETRFTCTEGSATLTDLMPVASEEHKRKVLWPAHELLREVRCTAGCVDIEIIFRPRANYGSSPVRLKQVHGLGLRMDVGRGAYWLRSSAPLTVIDGEAQATVRLKKDEVLQFSFTYAEESPAVLPLLGEDASRRIEHSIAWWQQWASRCSYRGPYRREVLRSALVLKLMTYAPSGAIVAAPTTSLPEIVGADQNWDYRYCWLRDASFSIRSLLGLGYKEEAESFINWLLLATRTTHPQLRVIYNLYGGNAPREQCLEYLSGYFDSRPVRIGNAARKQSQLDVYGEVIDAAAQYARDGGELDATMQKTLLRFGKELVERWNRPDAGIWEARFGKENHTYSRLMCWTALDRLIRMAKEGILEDAPVELFARERQRIADQIHARAWNEQLQSYVSVLDGDKVDATLLLLSWYGFEPADSDRMRQTYKRVQQELGAGDGLLYRYPRKPHEGAFGICNFWEVDYLACGGNTLERAHRQFESAMRYQNDLGLFSEEISPENGDALGNFPQAYTHLGVISAALTLQEEAAHMQAAPEAA